MSVETLGRLRTAFDRWRLKKRHIREAVPRALMDRACVAGAVYGLRPAAVALKLDPRCLSHRMKVRGKGGKKTHCLSKALDVGQSSKRRADRAVPFFSRVELASPVAAGPLAEVETPSGMKIKFFAMSPETVGLICALSGSGRAA